MPTADHRDFLWDESEFVLEELEEDAGPARLREDGRALAFGESRIVMQLPLVQTRPPRAAEASARQDALGHDAGGAALEELRAQLAAPLGLQCVTLVRAGAFALGLWDDEELVQHKAHKRYVTRGKGKAQSTHLKTRGKSRYGSRLRLQNQKAQNEELGERLTALVASYGEPAQLWLACPTRLLSELYACKTPPPFPRDAWRRVPLHVHEPSFEELLRVRTALVTGHVREEARSSTDDAAPR